MPLGAIAGAAAGAAGAAAGGLAGAAGGLAGAAGGLAGAAGGLAGGLAGPVTNNNLTYTALQAKYGDFALPQAEILMGGTVFATPQSAMVVGEIDIELSAGFEASVASFRIYNAYNTATGSFQFDSIKTQVMLGNALEIRLGYLGKMDSVFVGFIAGVSFGYQSGDLPYIEITGMDVKGVMMAGTFSYQLTAKTYSDAVSEIFRRTGYESLKTGGAVKSIQVSPTPDSPAGAAAGAGGAAGAVPGVPAVPAPPPMPSIPGGAAGAAGPASAYTVEMSGESDYEFVVKAAKRFNFEFFVDRGAVIFRKAKSVTTPLMILQVGGGLVNFQVEYALTGLVGSVEARTVNPGDGKLITAKSDLSSAISTGSKGKPAIASGRKVYIDPTISSQAEADARAASLMEQMSYRLGTFEADCVGIPELVPGRFVTVSGLGTPVDNNFYLTTVRHSFSEEGGYKTHLVGKAAQVGGAGGLGGGLGGGLAGAAAGAAGAAAGAAGAASAVGGIAGGIL